MRTTFICYLLDSAQQPCHGTIASRRMRASSRLPQAAGAHNSVHLIVRRRWRVGSVFILLGFCVLLIPLSANRSCRWRERSQGNLKGEEKTMERTLQQGDGQMDMVTKRLRNVLLVGVLL